MPRVTLEQANTIIHGIFKKAAEMKLRPMAAAVVDAGGHVIAFQRQDGAPFMRYQIAMGKAAGALGFGVSSRRLQEITTVMPNFTAAISPVAPTGFVPLAGGVILTDEEEGFIGAVGVTGDSADNDEICALAGIEAAGLKAQS